MLNFGGGGLVTKLYSTLVTLWTVACQAPLSMGFSRQEYWSGVPLPSPHIHKNGQIQNTECTKRWGGWGAVLVV